MAISGSFYGTTGNASIKPKITWSAEENIEGNYSDVTATLSYSRTDSSKTYGKWAGSLTINGDTKSVSGKYIEITKNSDTVAISHTVRVPHNDDGTKTVAISATGAISGTSLTGTTISGSTALTDIPRAASIGATDADIGSVSMVTIGKKSDTYTYTVAWQFGSLSGYLSESGPVEEAVTVTASSLAFPLPERFYYEIPDKALDICTLTCTTYLDGSAIGEPQTCTFLVKAAPWNCAPVVTLTAADVNPVTLALTGDANTFIRYASAAECHMSDQARCGATILERKLNGEAVTADAVTLEQLQTDRLRFTVKDSRSYITEAIIRVNVIPYFAPGFRMSAARTDATSGDATLQAEGSFFNGSFGAKSNDLRVQYQVNGGTAVSVPFETDGNTFSVNTTAHGLDYTGSHRITLTVSDAISSISAEVKINPGIPVFEWGQEDFRFHVPVFVQDKELLPLVEQTAATCVRKTGDTMEGDLSMGGNGLTDVRDPQADTDAATKAYADSKLSMVKLWENASYTSTFAAQTLSVPQLADYSHVGIIANWNSAAAPRQLSGMHIFKLTDILSDSGSEAHCGYLSMVINGGRASRKVYYDGSAGLQFATGNNNGTDTAAAMVPYALYGIKGVTA